MQLCAVSTVGIAATGFALARREPQHHLWSHPFTHSKDIAPGSSTRTDPVTARPLDVPIYGLRESKDSVADASPNWTLPYRRRERRRRQTYTNPPSNPSSESTTQDSATASGRPPPPRPRRLSVISSSNSGSPLPSPSTVSSLNGSTATTHSRTDSVPKFPNKLVKRSTSQHSIRPAGDRGRRPMSATLALRRPVTSHQRSADIAHRTSFNKENGLLSSPGFFDNLWSESGNAASVGSSKWRPYFSKAISRRKHSAGTVVTINPRNSSDHRYFLDHPTLLLSSSIDIPDEKKLVSRKQSLSQPSNAAMSSPSTRHGDVKKANSPGPIKREKRRPVRSSSFSNISGDNSISRSNSVRNNPKNSLVTTRQRAMERNISNPLPQAFDRLLADQSESPPLRRKRNFTWSDSFLRPQTAPQGKPPSTKLSNRHETSSKSHSYQNQFLTSPERSVSNEAADLDTIPSPSYPPGRGSSPPVVRYSKVKRLSGTASDRASTVIGSDDTRVFTSADEDDQSDSVFDSFRTRISSSSNSGRRGPNIETIFRDAPKKGNLADVDDLAFEGLHLSSCTPDSSISDLNSTSTPLASTQMKDGDTTPTSRAKPSLNHTVSPSPLKSSLDTHMCEVDADFEAEYHENEKLTLHPPRPNLLDFVEDDDFGSWDESPEFINGGQPSDVHTPSLRRIGSGIGIRASVFDWSEQTRNDRDTQDPEYRPSTVHGKQNTVGRGSRGTGRKAPSAVHLRSQSVPVSRDGPPSNESRQPSLKFGTWGLGQKGVSEDWDGDFDFGDADDNSADGDEMAAGNRGSFIMKVPQAIMESQASVHGQYGHVQELTLLVEELKRLRIQGNMLDLIHGPSADLWKEAEGIINLATLEEDENGVLAPASPSSCGSFDEFESPPQKAMKRGDGEIKRPPLAVWPNPGTNSSPSQKDPSSKVKSVLETIYQQREHTSHQALEATNNSIQKLPFDTQSLKDLVNRAGMVTRSLKDVIRRAEGVATSPESHTPSDPPFSRIFSHSP
ncbi:hypothetical protein PISL3812_02584 [Talaromyces islandicus]|uniref:Uncharacterized protein n=1 Tax=Talaromyces islandicus TaxID=28573 RepID=A0A0U1LQA5_TALIS|nr:hypothetical protein PISL3812_02584 [Talaromyces islandicus]